MSFDKIGLPRAARRSGDRWLCQKLTERPGSRADCCRSLEAARSARGLGMAVVAAEPKLPYRPTGSQRSWMLSFARECVPDQSRFVRGRRYPPSAEGCVTSAAWVPHVRWVLEFCAGWLPVSGWRPAVIARGTQAVPAWCNQRRV